jgi:hypothetical protein
MFQLNLPKNMMTRVMGKNSAGRNCLSRRCDNILVTDVTILFIILVRSCGLLLAVLVLALTAQVLENILGRQN